MTVGKQKSSPMSHGEAKEALRRAATLSESMGAFDDGPRILREQVSAAFNAIREDMVRREVAEIPIARLKDTTEGRLSIGPLERAGYTTVGKVLGASASRLQSIKGVGPATATQAVAAARQVADAVRTGLRFRVDLDPSNRKSTNLIATLYRADTFDKLAVRVKQHTAPGMSDLGSLLVLAAPTSSRLKMIIRGPRRRSEARGALDRVAQILALCDSNGVAADLDRAHKLVHGGLVSDSEAWKDFEKRSVEYYGRLGEIVDLGLDVAAAEGFLSTEIIERVNEQMLDDTFRRVSLRGYQSFGARFALVQRRVIIGDEMGLGKTIEAIAALAHLRALDHKHFLVACPASVLVNWTREISSRSTLRACRIHGVEREQNLKAWVRSGGVGVTTIDSLHRLRAPDDLTVAMLVIDEAHYVKNPAARRSRSAREWTARADRVLFLTGTPMENRVEEFRNLVDYLQPDLAPQVEPRFGLAGAVAFRKAVAPVYLRRNQEDVLQELPDLSRIDEWVEFTRDDRSAYWSAVAAGNFMAMRRAAYTTAYPTKSAKLVRLLELVDECADNGRKVVVFSFFRSVLDLVTASLPKTASSSRIFGPLTGATPPGQRQALIDRFSATDGHAVLVSQIQAGGVGLNMQQASVAILCEPQLKPTTEEQAVARLHRMGQVRAVQVYRLLATGSSDERLLEILDAKRRLFDDYARRSDIAESSPDAVDISEVELSRKIVELEQERMALAFMESGKSGSIEQD